MSAYESFVFSRLPVLLGPQAGRPLALALAFGPFFGGLMYGVNRKMARYFVLWAWPWALNKLPSARKN